MNSIKIFSKSQFSILWWSGSLSSFGDWATLFASVALASHIGTTEGNSEITAVVPLVARIIPAFLSSIAGLIADNLMMSGANQLIDRGARALAGKNQMSLQDFRTARDTGKLKGTLKNRLGINKPVGRNWQNPYMGPPQPNIVADPAPPNANTDTSTLTVKIQTSATNSNLYTYTAANDTTTVNSTANVYYLEEDEEGRFEVLFGDDVIGRKLVMGNIVILSSLVADGAEPNGAKTFVPVSGVGGYSNVVVSTITNGVGGAERDSIDTIKFNAPRNYQAQNRAVTINDYKRLLERDYPESSGKNPQSVTLSLIHI